MRHVFSLVVLTEHAECVTGQLGDPDSPHAVLDWEGRHVRLVHEQFQRDRDASWYIYGDSRLSKPETLARAQQWVDSSQHPYRPNLRG